MISLRKAFQRFWKEEDAPTMAEYGLLLVLIAIVVAAGATLLGTAINGVFNTGAGSMATTS